MTKTEKISSRPISINAEQSHLPAKGIVSHPKLASISGPKAGPQLLIQLMVTSNAMSSSIPIATKASDATININMYREMNAASVDCVERVITSPLTLIGSTAFGCKMRRNSLRMFFINITTRMLFIPPLVLPEHAPTIMQKKSIIHVNCGR